VNLDAEKISIFRQAGNFDKHILCLECEKKFSPLDAYGWKLLGNPDLTKPIFSHSSMGTVQAYCVTGCDTDKLRKFILSVLWRASVSSIEFYGYVRLGPKYEREVIDWVFSPNSLP
jgi:hypothetical protein